MQKKIVPMLCVVVTVFINLMAAVEPDIKSKMLSSEFKYVEIPSLKKNKFGIKLREQSYKEFPEHFKPITQEQLEDIITVLEKNFEQLETVDGKIIIDPLLLNEILLKRDIEYTKSAHRSIAWYDSMIKDNCTIIPPLGIAGGFLFYVLVVNCIGK